eukprot:Skav205558  [mRNA]  locus=scaffold1543:121791:125465:- [translate_table: standard]
MPGAGKADVSPSQFDMQWRTRVGCEEFWATFPVHSPRPDVHTEGLIPIRMETSCMGELLQNAKGKQSGFGDFGGDPSLSRRTSSIHGSQATPRKSSSRQSVVLVSHRSSQAVAALMLDGRSAPAGPGVSDLRQELQQERILRQKAEDEARQLRAKLATSA